MSAKIIDGREVAAEIRAECREQVARLQERYGIVPGLAVVLVGANPASVVYVRNKVRACADVGIRSTKLEFPQDVDPAVVMQAIEDLNSDRKYPRHSGPAPFAAAIRFERGAAEISVNKDVDGFHLYNVGGLVIGNTVFPPCTPYGVLKLLEHERIPLEGQNVVVVGASNIVGKPMALMLMQRDATVCICHAKTRDLAQFTILADILIVAAGQPNLILPQMVKTGAVVIDVGINRLENGKLVGDVDFEGVRQKAAYITPVPGGVGPMTVTMLLVNTIASARPLRARATPRAGGTR